MRGTPDTIWYDLFKLSIALILLIILILLLIWHPAPTSPQPLTFTRVPETTQTPVATARRTINTDMPEPAATQAELPPTPESPAALMLNPESHRIETSDGRSVYQLDEDLGEWVPVIPDELSSRLGDGRSIKHLTDGWVIETQDGETAYLWDAEALTWKEIVPELPEAAETETESAPGMELDCPLAKPSRLAAGIEGQVTAPLNIRSSPGILPGNLLFTMQPGTELKILGDPVCLPHHNGAYLWWQVEITGVQAGWSAEAPQNEDFYFIEPIE